MILVGIRTSEALGKTDGDVVSRFERGCPSSKWMVLGLVNVWDGCYVVSVDGRLHRGTKTKVVRSYAPRRPY